MHIAIIGGGPAGLRAAEVAAVSGATVTLFEGKASVGRKFLVAGRGGLNLTHAEPREKFITRYSDPHERWTSLITDFDADALRGWAAELGAETFAASTGRVYPRALKGAPLLRRWVQRLRDLGVHFFTRHRWCDVQRAGDRWRMDFEVDAETKSYEADAVILALGGGSWPETGSNGAWTSMLERLGVEVTPLQPANCGWEVAWPPELLTAAEGQPLKNIVARAGEMEARGELLITRYGLEGGIIYQLGAALRALAAPELIIDLKPANTVEQLIAKLGPTQRNFVAEAKPRWRLPEAAHAILHFCASRTSVDSAEAIARLAKHCTLSLTGPRPIEEAISSAGGVRWSELDDQLMLQRLPGIFLAGEMIDWEAPTGGYLLQGCFATGTRAARGALDYSVLRR
ncbi:MAG TPA: TIGR03862 family flavoprotein [Chthoniobacter sp.]|nr:TIGR03862 family flavoprotein [Chthoniobacter sp.]